MNALMMAVLAAAFGSVTNWFFRKNSDRAPADDNSSGFLIIYYLLGLIFSFIIYPDLFQPPPQHDDAGHGCLCRGLECGSALVDLARH